MSRPAREQQTGARTKHVLRLYVTGTTARSVRAIQNVRRICETHLAGAYNLEVIDLYKSLAMARQDQIFAAPTLIKCRPAPMRRLVGDMSDEARVLAGLDLHPKPFQEPRGQK